MLGRAVTSRHASLRAALTDLHNLDALKHQKSALGCGARSPKSRWGRAALLLSLWGVYPSLSQLWGPRCSFPALPCGVCSHLPHIFLSVCLRRVFVIGFKAHWITQNGLISRSQRNYFYKDTFPKKDNL